MTDLPHWTDPMYKSIYMRNKREEAKSKKLCIRCLKNRVLGKSSTCISCQLDIERFHKNVREKLSL